MVTTTKYIKFWLNPQGGLIYRKTGQIYMKEFSVKGHTVYGKNARKIGTVGNPSTSEQKIIETAKKNREKKLAKTMKNFTNNPKNLSFDAIKDAAHARSYADVPLDVYQTEGTNLVLQLDDMIENKILTKEEARQWYERWTACKNDSEHKKVWTDLRKYGKERGYEY